MYFRVNVGSERCGVAIFAAQSSCLDLCQRRSEFFLLLHFCSKSFASLCRCCACVHQLFWFRELQGNRIGGQIPTEIGKMSSMVKLNLMENQFSGSIPTELARLTSMVGLNLGRNNLDGVIDSSLFVRMSSLHYLAIFDTLISGVIPSEVGLLTDLTALFVSGNRFSGQIPSQLGQLVNLVEV